MPLKAKPLPSLEYLNSVLEFRDGLLYNKVTRNSRAVKDNLAGTKSGNYSAITLLGEQFLLHRIIYFMTHGFCPDFIDHIDGNPLNNKIDNLRKTTIAENALNVKLTKRNTTGYKNVTKRKSQTKWCVSIKINGKNKHLGLFEDLELADLVATEARDKFFGNLANHGVLI